MTRREFLRRSAPLIISGVVSTGFVNRVYDRLFGPPKRYWDMGSANKKVVDCISYNLVVDINDNNVSVQRMAVDKGSKQGWATVLMEYSLADSQIKVVDCVSRET